MCESGAFRHGLQRVEDLRRRLALDGDEPGKPALHAGERVIDENVATGRLELELGNPRAAGRHRHRLHPGDRLAGYAAIEIDAIEDLADDMEGGREIRPADTEEQ